MSKLTLPIRPGKYVRADGEIVEIIAADDKWADSSSSCYWSAHGGFMPHLDPLSKLNLVADYIEPAKGHPHAALMLEFARDAQENADPLSLWQWRDSKGIWRDWEDDCRIKSCAWAADREYRRRPKAIPDPHAATAAEYAKDMAETDKAWERWEGRFYKSTEWHACTSHPAWNPSYIYRRRSES